MLVVTVPVVGANASSVAASPAVVDCPGASKLLRVACTMVSTKTAEVDHVGDRPVNHRQDQPGDSRRFGTVEDCLEVIQPPQQGLLSAEHEVCG